MEELAVMNFTSRLWRLSASCAFVALIAGCASSGTAPQTPLNGKSLTTNKSELDASDPAMAVQISKMFRKEKRFDDALAVLLRSSIMNPDSGEIYAEMGKVLIERGAPKEGLPFLSRAASMGVEDWSLFSAAGVAYDELDQHEKAQENYRMALLHKPGEPTVLSNLGISYAMTGDLDQAEVFLRQANAAPTAGEVIRLNLALIVGLQGKFDEAEQIAQTQLPPAFAARNIEQLRAMLTQPDRWRDMRAVQKASSVTTGEAAEVPSETP
ncbi:MAG: tetratricopeptide repeat protein [Alphaproteobacteria bacterium]|nr:MAG: tetratricopeptide repeat protein [Alphaproteobacteria bacterium]